MAFSPEGLEDMNANITLYTPHHRSHKPILKARFTEILGQKFPVGESGNKRTKFVEAQSGTNLYFAIYETPEGVRSFETIPLNVVIERLKQGDTPVPQTNSEGIPLKFSLSPNDLVYVPTEEEQMNPIEINALEKSRIYKMVSATGTMCMFIKSSVATPIYNKFEFSPLNKMERSLDGLMIKAVCWKLQVDRLGNIVNMIR